MRAESVSTTLVYTYNAAGLRVAQSVDGEVMTTTWDMALPLRLRSLRCLCPRQRPESGFARSAQGGALAQVLATSDGGLNLHGLDLIAEQRGGAWSYALPDALGSVRQWADHRAAVTYAAGYRPYGQVLEERGSTDSAWGFTGEWYDGYLKFTYLRQRWYQVETGRFTSPDPIIPDYQNPPSINAYAYVWNSPVMWSDPLGLCPAGQEGACNVAALVIETAFGVDLDMDFNPHWTAMYITPDIAWALGRYPGCEENLWEWWELNALQRVLSDLRWFTGVSNFDLHIRGNVGIRRVHHGTHADNPDASLTLERDPRHEFPGITIEYTTDLFRPNGARASYAHVLRNAMHELMHAYPMTHDILVRGHINRGAEGEFGCDAAGWGCRRIPLRKRLYPKRNQVSWSQYGKVEPPTTLPTDYAETGIHDDFAETATMFAAYWLCANGNGDACAVRTMIQWPPALNPTTRPLSHPDNRPRVDWMENFFGRDFPWAFFPEYPDGSPDEPW